MAAIKADFNPDAELRKMQQKRVAIRSAIIANLFYIGEECLKEARSCHLYLNQTGNLCSSIGYCIIADGQIVGEKFFDRSAGRGGEKPGKSGKEAGLAYIHELAGDYAKKGGVTLLMVAGMPYAEYVEDMGLNVLDSSEQLAERKVREFINKHFTVK